MTVFHGTPAVPRPSGGRGPEAARIVAVQAGHRGSGYLLAPNLILTASHVLGDSVSCRAIAINGTGWTDCRLATISGMWAYHGSRRAWKLGLAYQPPFLRPRAWLPAGGPEATVRGAGRLAALGCALVVQAWLAAEAVPPGRSNTVDFSEMLAGVGVALLCLGLCCAALLWRPRLRDWDEEHRARESEYRRLLHEYTDREHAARTAATNQPGTPVEPQGTPVEPPAVRAEAYTRLLEYLADPERLSGPPGSSAGREAEPGTG